MQKVWNLTKQQSNEKLLFCPTITITINIISHCFIDKSGEATATLNRSNSQVALNSSSANQIMSPTTPGLTTPTTPEPAISTAGNRHYDF